MERQVDKMRRDQEDQDVRFTTPDEVKEVQKVRKYLVAIILKMMKNFTRKAVVALTNIINTMPRLRHFQ